MTCITDEAVRRARDGISRPGWPLRVGSNASVDTYPKGEDSTKIEAEFMGSAVPEGQTPNPQIPNPK